MPDRNQLPPDPVSQLTETAGAVAELYRAYVVAGIPAAHVAIMLGQWMAAMAQNTGPDVPGSPSADG